MKEEIKTILESEDLKEISFDIIEKGLNSEITNEIIKEIPIVKSLVAVKNLYTFYTDRIFIKKTMNVLLELSKIDSKQRANLISELDDDDSSGTEKILLAINRLETIKKCKVYGRLCKLKAQEDITVTLFFTINKVNTRCLPR